MKENFVVGVQLIEGEPQVLQPAAFFLPTPCEKSLLRGVSRGCLKIFNKYFHIVNVDRFTT